MDTTTTQRLKDLGLPPIDQIGFVVRDLDAAIAQYDALFGPFKKMEPGIYHASYRGQPKSPYDLRLAFGRTGDVEVELIQWVSGDTPHRDFIQAGREGMHHLRFRVDRADPWVEKLKAIGYEPVWQDRMNPEICYVYCERKGDPLIVEIFEYPADGDPTVAVPEG